MAVVSLGPIALVSLIVLMPPAIVLGAWYRNRRPAREYARADRSPY
jgi:hypothetical protein